ncbi:hypothetical protein A2U01_0059424, partial [Trifolium medium]|nr:hypothetical protein [Trifolium medium]
PKTWGHTHSSPNRTMLVNHTMAIQQMGDGYSGTVQNSPWTTEIPNSSSGLLHKVDRGKGTGHHYNNKRNEILQKEHPRQVRSATIRGN